MQGLERPAGLLSVEAIMPDFVDKKSVFGLLAAHRDEIFPPELVDGLFAPRSKAGRPSVPGSVMCSALMLQALCGLSDRETVDRLNNDVRWKAACGLELDERAFHHTTLVYSRKRIGESEHPRLIFDQTSQIVKQSKVLSKKARRVVDSTVIDDAVARQDVFTLLIWQIWNIGKYFPVLAERIDSLPGGVWYRDRLRPEIDWTDKQAKQDLVSLLVNDAVMVAGWAQAEIDKLGLPEDNPVRVLLCDEVGLLGVLSDQNVEPAPGSDGTDGRWRIATKTAPDRLLSLVDTQSRHIRKTTQNKHDGYKAHMVAEPETGLVVDVAISKGCGDESSDATNAIAMLQADPMVAEGQVSQVQGDSAYGSAAMLEALDQLHVEAVIKPRPLLTAVEGGFSLDDFQVSDDELITCPAGNSSLANSKGRASFSRWCTTCPLRGNCTKAKRGRIVTIGSDQLRTRRHRQAAQGSDYKDQLRKYRPMAERSIAWLVRPGRRTPYRGLRKIDMWFSVRAAGVNLKRLMMLGLQFTKDGWVIAAPT